MAVLSAVLHSLARRLFDHAAGQRPAHDFFTASWATSLFTQLVRVTGDRVSRDVGVVGDRSGLVSERYKRAFLTHSTRNDSRASGHTESEVLSAEGVGVWLAQTTVTW